MISEEDKKEVTADMKEIVRASIESFLEVREVLDEHEDVKFGEKRREDIEEEIFSSILYKFKKKIEKEQDMRDVKDLMRDSMEQAMSIAEGEKVVDVGGASEHLGEYPDCIGSYDGEKDKCVKCHFREQCKTVQSTMDDMDFLNLGGKGGLGSVLDKADKDSFKTPQCSEFEGVEKENEDVEDMSQSALISEIVSHEYPKDDDMTREEKEQVEVERQRFGMRLASNSSEADLRDIVRKIRKRKEESEEE